MKAHWKTIGTLILFAFIVAGSTNYVFAYHSDYHHSYNREGKGFRTNLTEEQRETIHMKITEMREEGADYDEIHATVANLFKEWDIELPEHFGKGHRGGLRYIMFSLTKEQREIVRANIMEMRKNGANYEDIHAAVAELFKGWDIKMPEYLGEGHQRGHRHFMVSLTEEQREIVHTTISEMKEAGVNHEEIHAKVAELFEGWGIEMPEYLDEGQRRGHRHFMVGLTEEQREIVHTTISEMREAGADHEEIHTTVAELLEGWGIEMPEHLGEGQRRDNRHLMFSLTEEQREIVHTTITKMREAGADREEIHVAVTKLLEGFGIESINNPGTMSSEMEAVGSLISAWSYPNPLTREMNIAYTLNSQENVQIQIYNSLGQFVQCFEMGVQEPSSYNVIWDGTDVNGIQAASGVYIYRIEAGTQTLSKSMILLE